MSRSMPARTADALTLARLGAAALVIPPLASGRWVVVALLVAFAWLTDLLDGRVARYAGEETVLGRYDLTVDTVFGGAVVVGLIAGEVIPTWLGIGGVVVLGTLFALGNVAAGMALQLTGYVPLLIELAGARPVTWWYPFLVALLAAILDIQRLVGVHIPAFIRGLAGRFEHRRDG